MSIFEATLSATQTYSGTAYATITGLALTPGAGTYLAIVTCSIGSAISGEYHYLALAVDGVEEADTEREHHNESSIADLPHYTEMMTHKVITVGAGEEIQARWKASATGNMDCPAGNLTLLSVASGDVNQFTATGDFTISATATGTDVTGMVDSNPGVETYLVLFSCSVRAGTITDTVHVCIAKNGTEIPHTERRYYCEGSVTTSTSYVLMCVAKVELTSATDDISVQAWYTGSASGTMHERTLTTIAGRTITQDDDTVDDTESTSGVDKTIDNMSFETPQDALAAGDYLVIGTGVFQFGSLGVSPIVTLKLTINGVEVTNSNRLYVWNDSLDNMDRCLAIAQKVVSTGTPVEWKWRCSTTDTRTSQERTIVAILDGAAAAREQENYRWRDDDADEDEAAWLAAEETNITRGTEQTTRLRILTDTATADPPAEGLDLEYKRVADAATEWRKVPLT